MTDVRPVWLSTEQYDAILVLAATAEGHPMAEIAKSVLDAWDAVPAAPASRWAAFSEDELDDIAEAIECSTSMRPLARWIDEIDAERERRRA